MTWEHASLSKSHFLDELLALLYTFTDEFFAFDYTFMDETRKFTNTKFTRNIDEENTKDTRNFAYFSSKQRTKPSGENSPLIYEKSVV